jgi:hypothetical protein
MPRRATVVVLICSVPEAVMPNRPVSTSQATFSRSAMPGLPSL